MYEGRKAGLFQGVPNMECGGGALYECVESLLQRTPYHSEIVRPPHVYVYIWLPVEGQHSKILL